MSDARWRRPGPGNNNAGPVVAPTAKYTGPSMQDWKNLLKEPLLQGIKKDNFKAEYATNSYQFDQELTSFRHGVKGYAETPQGTSTNEFLGPILITGKLERTIHNAKITDGKITYRVGFYFYANENLVITYSHDDENDRVYSIAFRINKEEPKETVTIFDIEPQINPSPGINKVFFDTCQNALK